MNQSPTLTLIHRLQVQRKRNSMKMTNRTRILYRIVCGPQRKKRDPILAEYGYYTRSMKPRSGCLKQHIVNPKHIVINVSESSCGGLLFNPSNLPLPITHVQRYPRRIYPDGWRVELSNLDPLIFWRSGA
ncbi:hypothetical protein JOM56_004959 [Amanita muscaria]